MKYWLPAVLAVLALWLLDYYVYRNWRVFSRYRRWSLRTTTRIYHILVYAMPLTLPLYIYFSRWWAVEPKLMRAAFAGFWILYYAPKIPVAIVLLFKDAARFFTWQFQWLQRHGTSASRPGKNRTEVSSGAPGHGEQRREAPDLTELHSMSRGEFLRRMGWTAASIPFAVVGYSVFRSLYDFQVREVTVRLPDLPAALHGIRLGHISDLHAGSFFSEQPVREAVALLNESRPDLVLFTGDFVNHDAGELERAIPYLAEIRTGIAAFSCLGNHDHYAHVPDVVNRAARTPLDLLVNEHRRLTVNGRNIYVIGTDNTGFNQHYADLDRATDGIPPRQDEDLRIVIAHDPSYWDSIRASRPDVDLTLSGHTHGGQVGFEFGPVRWSLARTAYQRWAGLYGEPSSGRSEQYLYVNRGLGTVGPPLRVGIRPEITILTLQRS